MQQREQRYRVNVSGRMRGDTGWAAIAIRNVSAHGMLLQADRPPQPGSYLEIRLADLFYAVRTVWRHGRLFGVRTRERIDLPRMLFGASQRGAATTLPSRAVTPDAHGANRIGSLLQIGFALAAAGLTLLSGERLIHYAFTGPIHVVEAHLLGGGDPP